MEEGHRSSLLDANTYQGSNVRGFEQVLISSLDATGGNSRNSFHPLRQSRPRLCVHGIRTESVGCHNGTSPTLVVLPELFHTGAEGCRWNWRTSRSEVAAKLCACGLLFEAEAKIT